MNATPIIARLVPVTASFLVLLAEIALFQLGHLPIG
jgi:hypothetical protein